MRKGASQLGPQDNKKKTETNLGTQGVWSLSPRVHSKEFEPQPMHNRETLIILIGGRQHQPYFFKTFFFKKVIWILVCRTDGRGARLEEEDQLEGCFNSTRESRDALEVMLVVTGKRKRMFTKE